MRPCDIHTHSRTNNTPTHTDTVPYTKLMLKETSGYICPQPILESSMIFQSHSQISNSGLNPQIPKPKIPQNPQTPPIPGHILPSNLPSIKAKNSPKAASSPRTSAPQGTAGPPSSPRSGASSLHGLVCVSLLLLFDFVSLSTYSYARISGTWPSGAVSPRCNPRQKP